MTRRRPLVPRRLGIGRAHRIAALAALLLVTAGSLDATTAPPVAAIDHSKGTPGFCPTATGVTVVVDFQDLGGEIYVRCFPSASPGTGLDALKGAGFQIEGVRRWGESFICRIENRPSAVETVPIEGNDRYQEQCVDTPPAAGYWSYWHAGNNCDWAYSQWGVKNRTFIPGGFEGWSYSLNATADDNPAPRVAPTRPGTEGGRCTMTPEAPPLTDDPDEQAPGVGGGTGGGSASPDATAPTATDFDTDTPGGGAVDTGDGGSGAVAEADGPGDTGSNALPRPRPREETAAPTRAPAPVGSSAKVSGGEDAPDVRDVLRDQDGGVWWAPWLAGVVIVGLAVGMWQVTRRRRRAMEA